MTNVFDSVVPIQMADDEDMYKCVHCGLCLSVCPTYVQTGLETESPRGRIHFMKSVSEGRGRGRSLEMFISFIHESSWRSQIRLI